jgi:hypothetical protein
MLMPLAGYSIYGVLRVLVLAYRPSGDERLGVSVTRHLHRGDPEAADGRTWKAGAEGGRQRRLQAEQQAQATLHRIRLTFREVAYSIR